jgi:hypothetical protein
MQMNTGSSITLTAETHLIYVHMTLCTLLACDYSIGILTLPVYEAGDFLGVRGFTFLSWILCDYTASGAAAVV